MKVLIVALGIAAGYYYFLTATTDLALQQTQQMHQQYQSAIATADDISDGSWSSQH